MWKNPATTDLETIRDTVNRYYEGKPTGRGSGYKQWKRWEAFNETRLDANGQLVNVGALNYEAYLSQRPAQSSQRNQNGDWHPWSATQYSNNNNSGSWAPGIGRVNDVAFHPTDPNTVFVATPAGGVFKTTNNGQSWTCLTQILGNLGCSGIVINPSDPNNMYILTGDGDGRNTRSIGVYVTFDGGSVWLPTSLLWGLNDNYYARKIVMEPGFPSWMMVGSTQGLWQTTDSGSSWNNVLGGEIFDIEYHPSNTAIVYASTANKLYKSTNWGQNWTEKYTISGATRIEIAVSPDDASKVYLIAGPSEPFIMGTDTTFGFKGLHVSGDEGESFAINFNSPNILSPSEQGNDLLHQTTHDLAIAVDPSNASTIFMGGVNLWKYTDNSALGVNAHWLINHPTEYVHADVHDLAYNPLNGFLYAASDGGIFFTANAGNNWTDITPGLNISQLYHIAGTPQNADIILGGMQDNGTARFNGNNVMTTFLGADGGDVLINPTNVNILYAMTQEGDVRRSTNGGTSFSSIKPAGSQKGPFVTRWDMDPNTPTTIRMGWTNDTVYTTNNSGTSWSKVKLPGGGNKNVRSISVAGNSTTIYAVTTTKAFVTTNSGMTWTEFDQANGPSGYTSITAHPTIPTIAFYTEGGFGPLTGRVMIYNNGAVSEVEGTLAFSGELPEVPVNVVISRLKNGIVELYAGTDIGVYHFTYEDTDAGWTPFKAGLPNVIVNDLVIHQAEGIIRAGTYGRGIWQSDLWHECEYELNLTQANDPDQGTPVFQYHEARNLLTSNRWIIGSNGNVTYKSKDLVILSNGFRASEGNRVLVGLKPCGQTLE